MKTIDNPPSRPEDSRLRRIAYWLDHRTGIETAVKNFLYENIPASSGWRQVLGSIPVGGAMAEAVARDLAALESHQISKDRSV